MKLDLPNHMATSSRTVSESQIWTFCPVKKTAGGFLHYFEGIKIPPNTVQVSHSVVSLCNPRNCSTPGLPVHHQLPEFTQTHVHWVGDAIQLSHPVIPFSSCPHSFPASESVAISQLFASGGQTIGVSASVLSMNIQGLFPLRLSGLILQSRRLWRVFSSTTVQKHQFFGAQLVISAIKKKKNINGRGGFLF